MINFENQNIKIIKSKNKFIAKYKLNKNEDMKSFTLNNRDINTLNNNVYINDEIINNIAKLMITKRKNYDDNNVMLIDSLQYDLLVNRLNNSDRLKKKFGKKFSESDKIVIIRNIKKHWIVYGVNKLNNNHYKILVLDSLKSYTERIDKLHSDIMKIIFTLASYNNEEILSIEFNKIDVEQQPNNYDCGIFSLLNIDIFVNNGRKYKYKDPCKFRPFLKNYLM